MKTRLMVLLLLTGCSMFAATHFYVGFGYAPAPVAVYAPPPPPVYYAQPVMPGPGYSWVAGYWYPSGPRWAWHAGYWARPPYARSYWVAPRYFGGRFYGGHWRR
jgi:hypothetical protein